MLTGERRLASGRRSGMTVVGKVAVPKPINLPSQRLENHGLDPNVEIVPKGTLSWGSRSSSSTSRLENHGLDPNVEIVPKGTLSWGSRSSSSTSNPRGSLSQSPNTDGGTSSPSHLNGRPSSGESGTRPSTAGSDRAHESTTSAWGPNSRPSSASGVVGSNQTSLALLRPRSAETRPSSSQLSRFAEASSENPVAWSSAATAEKLGVVRYKDEGFALTSGDFPMLGSKKSNSGKNSESQDHRSTSRPGSSSGGVALTKEISGTSETDDVSHNENVKIATLNSWNRDNSPQGEDGARYTTEKWQEYPRPYTGTNMVLPPYDTLNCIPANTQGGVWYRGPRGRPPHGTLASPGSCPMEPFPYYHPHSPGPLPNPQPVHPTGIGPRGHHPQCGDVYRHPVADTFIRPAMPIRPGFYPGPVLYEGYYRPPRGYINEGDAAFPGMVGASSVYNKYPSQNAPHPNSLGRSSECGSKGLGLVSEKSDSSYSRDSQRSLKVLTNQHNCWDDEIVGQNGESSFEINQPPLATIDEPRVSSQTEMVDQPRIFLQEKLGLGDGNDGNLDVRRRSLVEEASLNTSSYQETHASYPIKAESSPENVGNSEAVGDFSLNKLELRATGYSEVPQFLPATAKDSSLIQKIEELNVKARASDGRHEGMPIYSMEEEGNRIRVKSVKTTPSENEDCGPVYSERPPVDGDINPASVEISLSSIDKSNGRGGISISRLTREMPSRVSHRERKNFIHDVAERRKRFPVDSQGMVMESHPETSNDHAKDLRPIEEADSFPLKRHEEESVQSVFDSNVDHVQRSKMRELAKQRTKQLQEVEEERTRKQKAKAWAKLEELNRRTKAEAEPIQSCDNTPGDVIKDKQEESITFGAIRMSDYLSGKYSRVDSKPRTVAHKIEKSTIENKELPVSSTEKVKGGKEELVDHNQFVPLNHDVNVSTTTHNDTVTQLHNGNSMNLKRTSYKDKQIDQSEKSTDKSTFDNVRVAQNIQTQGGAINASLSEADLHVTVNSESSAHSRKKNNKSGKSKNKVEDGSLSAIPTSLSEENNHTKSGKPLSESEAVSTSTQPLAIPEDANHSSDRFSSPAEDSKEKGNGQGKSRHSCRTSRNLQTRSSEKFHSNDAVIWAPVRSLNKSKVTDEGNQKTEAQAISPSMKADWVQSNSKNKRAEMERYVPKPVAREMAQQGSTQQPEVGSKKQTTSDDNRSHSNSPDTTGSTTGNLGPGSESRIGDGKHYKQSKSHQLWQQRGDAELKNGQGLQDHSASKSVELQQSQKALESYSDEWNPPEGWNIPNSDSVAPINSRVARDQGNTGRGKQQQFKGQKVLRSNFDLDKEKLNCVEDEKKYTQSLGNEVGQRDFTAASKENRGFGYHPTFLWQPKGFSSNNQQGNRSNHSQNIINESFDNSSSFQKDESNSKKGILSGPNAHHREAKSEKKKSLHRGRPHSPNEGLVNLVEIAPASTTNARSSEQSPPSGFHKGRLARGSDAFQDRSSGHDTQHNPLAYKERPKHNFHYEYERVGPHGSNQSYNSDEAKDNASSRYRERGRNNSRQGGTNSRQVHIGVDTSYS